MPCPTWKNLEQLGWRISNCMFDRIPAIVFSREKAYLCSPCKLIPSNHQLWLWPQKVFLASILLMIQKSGDHQLRLVVYPIIYRVLYIPNGDRRIFFHQPYVKLIWEKKRDKTCPLFFGEKKTTVWRVGALQVLQLIRHHQVPWILFCFWPVRWSCFFTQPVNKKLEWGKLREKF